MGSTVTAIATGGLSLIPGVGDAIEGMTGALTGRPVGTVGSANIDRTAFDPNAQEQSLTDMLVARANGTMPSSAEQQMRNGLDQAARQSSSMAASARGVNPALAARLAQQSGQSIASQGIGQTAALRAQEQSQATGQAAGMIQDQRQSRGAREQLNVQNITGANTINSNAANAASNRQANLLSGLGQGAMAMSDERVKTDVRPGGAKIQDFLDAISAEEYQYKDQSMGEGDMVSPMAQDLEKTPLGNQMVMDTPQGKAVDYGKGMGAILAAQAHLNERLNKIEGGTQKLAQGGYAGYEGGVREAVAGTKNLIGADLKEMKMEKPGKPGAEDAIGGATGGGGAGGGSTRGLAQSAMAFNDGAKVPGRAKVSGDSEQNDTVKALLSPGELVIPRTVVQAGPDAIKKFAEALLEEGKGA